MRQSRTQAAPLTKTLGVGPLCKGERDLLYGGYCAYGKNETSPTGIATSSPIVKGHVPYEPSFYIFYCFGCCNWLKRALLLFL